MSRDTRIADETYADRAFMCIAIGCPNRWSVDAGNGRLCSAHAWADPSRWPAITQEQGDAETDRAYRAQMPKPAPLRLTHEERKGLIARARQGIREFIASTASKAWAARLKAREESGERLTPAQREMWRDALRHREVEGEQ